MPDAQIIPLRPPRTPACYLCVHSLLGERTFCTVFEEWIDFEVLAASDCEVYEEDPSKT